MRLSLQKVASGSLHRIVCIAQFGPQAEQEKLAVKAFSVLELSDPD